MINIHDVGGFHFPAAIETKDEVTFHSDWEAMSFGMLLATSTVGSWSLDEFRHTIEQMHPADYLTTPYYVHWIHAMEELSLKEGWITRDELTARQQAVRAGKQPPAAPEIDPDKAEAMSKGARDIAFVGLGARRPDAPQRYSVGDRVRARQKAVAGHTRVPRFVWGKPGVVVAYSGTYPLPDTNAHRLGENPEPTYAVRFEGSDIWGEGGEPNTSVTLDMFESYMDLDDPATTAA